MKLVPFTPKMKLENLWVTSSGLALPKGTRVTVEVDLNGETAVLTHILPEGTPAPAPVVEYNDCKVNGATLTWTSESKMVVCAQYRLGKIRRLVGVIHSLGNDPVEEWVAEDDGGSQTGS